MDSARVGYLTDFAGRGALVALFGYMATNNIAGAVGMIKDPAGPRFLDLAAALASLAFVTLVVGMAIIRLKPIRSAEGFEPRVSALVGTGLSLAIALLPQSNLGVTVHVVSLIMLVVGWCLSAYVLLWLGRAFSIMAQARSLVTTGPYGIVRHPLYLCEEIAVLGIMLTHFSIEAILIVALQWLFQLRRMTNEEKVLRAAFPEYAAYAKQTPKVIPRLVPKFSLGLP